MAQDVALGNSQPPPENLDTMEEAYNKVSLNGVLKPAYDEGSQKVHLKRLKNLLLDINNKTFDDSTRDSPKEQKKWYIPDEQFNNLIFRIEEAFPELKYNKAATPESQPKAVAWRAATDRQQKERSYFKHGRGSVSAWFSKKTKGLGGKPRRTKKGKHIKYKKTKGGKYRKTKTRKPKYKKHRKTSRR